MPCEQLQPHVQGVIDRHKEGKRRVVEHRLGILSQYRSEFTAIGQGGFSGYVVFGFPKRNLYVLECALYGNATYVLERDWETISRMTKAQILNENLHKVRLVHVGR